MLRFLRLVGARVRQIELERLLAHAGKMDELLMTGQLLPATRQQLQDKREQLRCRIQALMVV